MSANSWVKFGPLYSKRVEMEKVTFCRISIFFFSKFIPSPTYIYKYVYVRTSECTTYEYIWYIFGFCPVPLNSPLCRGSEICAKNGMHSIPRMPMQRIMTSLRFPLLVPERNNRPRSGRTCTIGTIYRMPPIPELDAIT